ncbi:MAG: glycosyltransferase family 2 protein, partial [Synergistaceae bacterium]|nr:glycosyltransferase family 2 protein [Synergistaceae bacterium]
MPPRISVVMAAYNGAEFIREQLDSIREQTLPPDEVIIADDCSTDGTYELCREYIAGNNLAGWTVYQNPGNLGVRRNFREALRKCAGDYVFTCDQDDIWIPGKIHAMTSAMNDNPGILLLASNYIPVRDGRKIAHSYVKNLERDDGGIVPFRLVDCGLGNLRPGCTFCFRRELLARFSVMDIPDRLHDSMLWKYAIVADGLYLLNRQLVLYRRHSSNATNQFSRIPPNITQRLQGIDSDSAMYAGFLEASDGLSIPEHNRKVLSRHIEFLHRRRKVLQSRSPVATAIFVCTNLKHYPTLRNALSDIYAAVKLR